MKIPPFHIYQTEEYEPLFIPNEHIMEDCIRKEVERAVHEENLLNKVVYDCVDPSPHWVQSPTLGVFKDDTINQTTEFRPYYRLQDENDNTLVFESRFESGNLRRAIKV